jgi:hypothetical protein
MELVRVNDQIQARELVEVSSDSFIHANSTPLEKNELYDNCIIPVFAKDNESTISHPEFIDVIADAAHQVFKNEQILLPSIRVSHPIKGRIPEAIGKPVKELREDEKTIYYERMAFVVNIPTVKDTVNGNDLSLSVGGVRAYNHENLYSRKTEERFKVFIGFKNLVCINLCISTDGFKQEIRARTVEELAKQAMELFGEFNAHAQLQQMNQFGDYSLTEEQFAHMVGKAKMFSHLLPKQRENIPAFPLSETQITTVIRDYFKDESFARNDDGTIDLWRLYNLLTGANKSSYIDSFLDRDVGSYSFTQMLLNHLENHEKSWYLLN